jgi:hypothetical protein
MIKSQVVMRLSCEGKDVTLTSGEANAQGRVVYRSSAPDASLASFTGELALQQIATVDSISSKPLVAWDMLALNGIRADVSPTDIARVADLADLALQRREPHVS